MIPRKAHWKTIWKKLKGKLLFWRWKKINGIKPPRQNSWACLSGHFAIVLKNSIWMIKSALFIFDEFSQVTKIRQDFLGKKRGL